MSDVTRILSQIESGDPSAAEQLLPLVYDELRKLAAAKLAQEKPGQTLQATALVHEAYLRLVDSDRAQHWDSRGHFFAAAAEAMRRILVDQARRKSSLKRGGAQQRAAGDWIGCPRWPTMDWPWTRHSAGSARSQDGRIGQTALFAGLSPQEAAQLLGISPGTAPSMGLCPSLADSRVLLT